MMVKQTPTQMNLVLAGPESEVSHDFFQYMINRMVTSYHKYGPVAEATTVDCMSSAWQRMAKYHQTGNTEWLVDAANFLMMEFMKHPDGFRATDSDESIGRVRVDGEVNAGRN